MNSAERAAELEDMIVRALEQSVGASGDCHRAISELRAAFNLLNLNDPVHRPYPPDIHGGYVIECTCLAGGIWTTSDVDEWQRAKQAHRGVEHDGSRAYRQGA